MNTILMNPFLYTMQENKRGAKGEIPCDDELADRSDRVFIKRPPLYRHIDARKGSLTRRYRKKGSDQTLLEIPQ